MTSHFPKLLNLSQPPLILYQNLRKTCQNIKKWERVDKDAETFVFSNKDGPLWEKIIVRETYDVKTNNLIAKEYVQHIPAKELGRVLPEWVEEGTGTVFYYNSHSFPSKREEHLDRPSEKDSSDVVFFGSEIQADVHECFWLSPEKEKMIS